MIDLLSSWKITKADFSLRENVRSLMCPPKENRFAPLDGLRALSMIWIVFFHSLFIAGHFMSSAEFLKYATPMSLRWIVQGEFGVDVFFVISGFLIGHLLMSELYGTRRIDLPLFYMRRFLRLMPSYFVCLVLFALLFQMNLKNIWANLLYINNYLPMRDEAMEWTWSLAIEEQFYLFLPPILIVTSKAWRLRTLSEPFKHLAVFSGLILFGLALRAWIVSLNPLSLPLPLHPVLGADTFYHHFNIMYQPTHMRFGELLAGVIAAVLLCHTKVVRTLKSFGLLRNCLVITGFGLSLAVALIDRYFSWDYGATAGAIYLVTYRYLFSFGVAVFMLGLCAPGGEESLVSRFLGWRFFYPFAQLSYGSYLLHPLLIGAAFYIMEPLPPATVGTIYLRGVASLAGTLALATLLYLMVEKPFMNTRKRIARQETAPAISVETAS
jgi:peptidoglycan/LPS O-acetylase OafA/YrhL